MSRRALLIAIGLMLVLSQALIVGLAWRYESAAPTDISEVIPLIVLLALPAALSLAALPVFIQPRIGLTGTVAMLMCGLLMRLVWFGAPAPLESDYYRYLWDGALVAHGLNPYRLAPSQVQTALDLPVALQGLREAGQTVLVRINFPELNTIYPGVAQLSFATAHLIAQWSLDALRMLFLLADAAASAILLRICDMSGRSRMLASAYWMNPLVVFVTVGTAHVDALLAPLLLGMVLLLVKARPAGASTLLALAVGVKVWPLLFLPVLFAEMIRRRMKVVVAAIIFLVISSLALAPLLTGVLLPNSGLASYAQNWSNNNGPFAWLTYVGSLVFNEAHQVQIGIRVLTAAIVCAVAVLCAARPAPCAEDMLARLMIIGATLFYLSPAQFPWYAIWFLPFAASTAYRPLLLASATLPAYYLFFPFWESGRGDMFMFGVAFVHSVPVWSWILWNERRNISFRLLGRNQEAHDSSV